MPSDGFDNQVCLRDDAFAAPRGWTPNCTVPLRETRSNGGPVEYRQVARLCGFEPRTPDHFIHKSTLLVDFKKGAYGCGSPGGVMRRRYARRFRFTAYGRTPRAGRRAWPATTTKPVHPWLVGMRLLMPRLRSVCSEWRAVMASGKTDGRAHDTGALRFRMAGW